MALQKASRKKVKLRLSIAAPTGFGKTTSALMIAHGMGYDWDKICVIDTENRSASLYAEHTFQNGYKTGEYFVNELEPPFTPEKYIDAIKDCENAGIEVIIIDSATHVWQGQGGLLESHGQLPGNNFQNWAKTTPRYQNWLNAILHSKCHVITTLRKKQAYSMVNEGGKTKIEKKGMDDQIRDGFDYEMTVAFDIISEGHLAAATKDRSSLFMGKPEFILSEAVGVELMDWCNKGKDPVQDAVTFIESISALHELASYYTNLNADLKGNTLVIAAKDKRKVELTPKNTDNGQS